MSQAIQELFKEVRDCTYCDSTLPMGPRPIVRGGTGARICIIGQAPGIKVHKSGVPWLIKAESGCVNGCRWTKKHFITKTL